MVKPQRAGRKPKVTPVLTRMVESKKNPKISTKSVLMNVSSFGSNISDSESGDFFKTDIQKVTWTKKQAFGHQMRYKWSYLERKKRH